MSIKIRDGGLDNPQVQDLLHHHVASARAETALGSAHALDLTGLQAPDVRFWSAWEENQLLGVGALKQLSATHGEVKSMHTTHARRQLGVGSAIINHIVDTAQSIGLTRLSLETGSWSYFEPTRAFYHKHGFTECEPFANYVLDDNSVFMTREL